VAWLRTMNVQPLCTLQKCLFSLIRRASPGRYFCIFCLCCLLLCYFIYLFFDFVPFVFVRFGMLSACVLPAWIDVQKASLVSTSCIVYRPSSCLVHTHVLNHIFTSPPPPLGYIFFLVACLLVFRYFFYRYLAFIVRAVRHQSVADALFYYLSFLYLVSYPTNAFVPPSPPLLPLSRIFYNLKTHANSSAFLRLFAPPLPLLGHDRIHEIRPPPDVQALKLCVVRQAAEQV
jgi:hypothetical protein